jgi:hypothetical protein
MSEVLEHVRRPGEVVCRCFAWLAPGGTLLITTPHGHWESNEHLHEFDLVTFSRVLALPEAETGGTLKGCVNGEGGVPSS